VLIFSLLHSPFPKTPLCPIDITRCLSGCARKLCLSVCLRQQTMSSCLSSSQTFPDTDPAAFVAVDTTGSEHYNMAVTNVTLLVTDIQGLNDSCTSTVTVVVSVCLRPPTCGRHLPVIRPHASSVFIRLPSGRSLCRPHLRSVRPCQHVRLNVCVQSGIFGQKP
jgi:hypothetical protein